MNALDRVILSYIATVEGCGTTGYDFCRALWRSMARFLLRPAIAGARTIPHAISAKNRIVNMKRLLLSLLASLVTLPAIAATGTSVVNWTNPTTYVDGTALASGAITGYFVDCQFTPTGGVAAPCVAVPTIVTGQAVTVTSSVTYPSQGGRICYRIRVRTGAETADPSNEGCKDFPALKPGPATNVTVAITVTISNP